MDITIPPIYPITDKRLSQKNSHFGIVQELVRGGATWVQIRDKETPVQELLLDIQRCVDFATRNDVVVVVNDRSDLVLSSGAAGVHLGQDDLPPGNVRDVLGPARIVGYSTHSLAQVRQSARLPVNYIGFGPIYSTKTKEKPSPVVGLTLLGRACKLSTKPVVAIGGIQRFQIQSVLRAGAASVAIISALMRSRNLAREMEELLKCSMETR